MMAPKRYRITTPTVAILSSNGEREMVTVPAEAIVTATDDPRSGDRLIDVSWNDKDCLMFTQDLRERSVPIPT